VKFRSRKCGLGRGSSKERRKRGDVGAAVLCSLWGGSAVA
jgi:hypothetical protein